MYSHITRPRISSVTTARAAKTPKRRMNIGSERMRYLPVVTDKMGTHDILVNETTSARVNQSIVWFSVVLNQMR